MSSRRIAVAALAVALTFACASCGGSSKKYPTTPAVPATTTAAPAGGTYTATLTVTLTADRAATIYYSHDGGDPSAGGANTTAGASPISGIAIPNGVTVLKFFSVTSEGATEAIRTETYTVDALAPTVTFISGPPGPFGVLSRRVVTWQTNKAGTYSVEFGGSGPGTGTVLATGSVAAGVPTDQVLYGYMLSFAAPTTMHVYVTDGASHTGTISIDLGLKPLVPIALGGELRRVAIAPSGLRAYVARTDGNALAVIDTDPSSGGFNNVITSVPLGAAGADGVAVTPDGSRVYVTNNFGTSISVVATASNTVAALVPAGDNPGGIAITPDGTRAYCTTFDGNVRILDTNPASASYHQLLSMIHRDLLLYGTIAIAPNGTRAIVNWAGSIATAVDMIDVDPSSPTRDQIVGSPLPVVSGFAGDVAFAPNSAAAFSMNDGDLVRIDVPSGIVTPSNAPPNGRGIAVTPDGLQVLFATGNTLRVVDPATVLVLGSVVLGNDLGYMAITPDGQRAYVTRRFVDTASELVCVPLR